MFYYWLRKILYLCHSFILVFCTGDLLVFAQESPSKHPSLSSLIQKAMQNNPIIGNATAIKEAEDSLITSQYAFDDPMIGVSQLNRGNNTQYAVIAQQVKFPVKYFIQGSAQKNRALSATAERNARRWEVRGSVTSLYYSIYAVQKIIQLTEANLDAVREFARVAEKKYAAAKGTQGDSMKAHFELTRLELELIQLRQQEEALQANLSAVLSDSNFTPLQFSSSKIIVPKFESRKIETQVTSLSNQLQKLSPPLQTEIHRLDELTAKSTLADWEYAPDFELRAQQRISGMPSDSQIYTLSMTIPLWFWKKSANASAASSRKIAQEYQLKAKTDQLVSQVKDLKGKVKANAKTLNIYETSLIPQAQSAYNSSRGAYRASRTTFLDLLDSERSLYQVKTGYYRALQQYVHNLVQLESSLGFTISEITGVTHE